MILQGRPQVILKALPGWPLGRGGGGGLEGEGELFFAHQSWWTARHWPLKEAQQGLLCPWLAIVLGVPAFIDQMLPFGGLFMRASGKGLHFSMARNRTAGSQHFVLYKCLAHTIAVSDYRLACHSWSGLLSSLTVPIPGSSTGSSTLDRSLILTKYNSKFQSR